MEDLKEFLWRRVGEMIEKEKENLWYLVKIHRHPGVRYDRKKSRQKLDALHAAIQMLNVLEEDEIPVRVSVEAHSSIKSGALDETVENLRDDPNSNADHFSIRLHAVLGVIEIEIPDEIL